MAETSGTPPLTADEIADLNHWQQRLVEARDGQAADLKADAVKWSGYVATLLGTAGSVSVVVAPKALADFTDTGLRAAAVVVLGLAAVGGLAAFVLAVVATGVWPRIDATMDAAAYRRAIQNSEVHGVGHLRWSRWLTGAAIFLVLVGSALSVLDTLATPMPAVQVVVVHRGGSTSCGPISPQTDALSVVVVERC